jgi:hypothetical protein
VAGRPPPPPESNEDTTIQNRLLQTQVNCKALEETQILLDAMETIVIFNKMVKL